MFNRAAFSNFFSVSTSAFFHATLFILFALLVPEPTFEQAPQVITITPIEQEVVEIQDIELPPIELEIPEIESLPDSSLVENYSVDVGAMELADYSVDGANFDSPFVDEGFLRDLGTEVGRGDDSVFGSNLKLRGTSFLQGDNLLGRLYDLKQNRERRPLPYSGDFPEYIRIINRLAQGGFSESVTSDYYRSETQLALSQLLIPANTPATDAPKAFNVEGEVEPRGWVVHYTGTVVPPENGEWRFVGFFDDLLIVFVDGQPVLDGSWVPMCGVGLGPYDETLRQEFGGPGVSGVRTAYAGKWFPAKKPIRLDILVGETPGGLVGGLLMVQQRGAVYEMRPDGTPILPLFAVSHAGTVRVREEPFAKTYQLVDTPPIWKPKMKKGR